MKSWSTVYQMTYFTALLQNICSTFERGNDCISGVNVLCENGEIQLDETPERMRCTFCPERWETDDVRRNEKDGVLERQHLHWWRLRRKKSQWVRGWRKARWFRLWPALLAVKDKLFGKWGLEWGKKKIN